jgi:hypothetical protein
MEPPPMTDDEHAALLATYREARDSVAAHLALQGDAERDVVRVLRRLRGVPAGELYDRATGDPIHPDIVAAEAAVAAAVADVAWCRCVTVAAAEAAKGEPLLVVLARNRAAA